MLTEELPNGTKFTHNASALYNWSQESLWRLNWVMPIIPERRISCLGYGSSVLLSAFFPLHTSHFLHSHRSRITRYYVNTLLHFERVSRCTIACVSILKSTAWGGVLRNVWYVQWRWRCVRKKQQIASVYCYLFIAVLLALINIIDVVRRQLILMYVV